MKTKAIGIAATALLLALSVKANTVSYSSNIGTQTFDFGSTALALQQFDTSLGTLNSITISLAATSYTDLSVHNTSPGTYGDGSDVWNEIQITLGSSTFDAAVDALNPNAGGYKNANAWVDVMSPYFYVSGLTAGDTWGFSGDNTAFSGRPAVTSGITSGTVFTDLQGVGTVNLDVLSHSTVDSSISGGATFQANETVTGGVTAIVTYNYTAAPVPEPTTMALFGIGSLGLFLIRRRK